MKTPAQELGLEVGMKCIYTSTDGKEHEVVLKSDDGDNMPEFTVPTYLDDDNWMYIELDYIKLAPAEAAVEAVIPAFSVNVGGGMTIIELGKELTAKQVAAVLEAAGVE